MKEITVGSILLALLLAILLSILATHYFYRMINSRLSLNDKVKIDLLSSEQLVYRTNSNLKRHWIFQGGVLYLTSQRICFIYTEFRKNKLILNLDKDEISEVILKNNDCITLKTENNQNYVFIVENNNSFYEKYLLAAAK